ncbi:hypothetical protein [Flavobacterium sp. 102]|uniref:hypothetical protein n=1 Tax=Flavobacterium sp. 102 TaxID=2135623 RepID=UPI000EAF665D|nr:hypothetical protein [Flavobacterium sp. 102]RKS00437.1 hypothetical protein C8C84_0047 [Flavobacterium sp. 102]
MSHSEKTIIDVLHAKYAGNSKFRIPNVFLFRWESDFFVQKDNGYCYEFEIKISKSDFRRDAAKTEKISILQTGGFIRKEKTLLMIDNKWQFDDEGQLIYENNDEPKQAKRPNKFYYVVPEGMITKFDVPEYSGLIYVTETGTKTIKEAPFLHRDKLDLHPELCNKFYWYWLNQRDKNDQLEREIKMLRQKLEAS